MERFLIIITLALFGATATPILEKRLPRFIQFPDGDGVMHWIDLEDDNLPPNRFDPDADMKYLMYNRENAQTPVEFFKHNNESIFATKFNPNKPVKITIHGWGSSGGSKMNLVLADAFLGVMDVNVIVVDWAEGASGDYITSCLNVPRAGEKVGELMDWLNILGVPFSNIHVLGYSLGGHVAGVSGRTATRGVVEYITGLDPAFPLWTSTSQRIRPSDGKYVEVIHTNGGYLGLMEPVGQTDFYPNGGRVMPGCSVVDTGCSHSHSFLYMADSIDHEGFMANKCSGVEEIGTDTCANSGKLHMGGSKIKLGYEGVYALKTNMEKPYYQG